MTTPDINRIHVTGALYHAKQRRSNGAATIEVHGPEITGPNGVIVVVPDVADDLFARLKAERGTSIRVEGKAGEWGKSALPVIVADSVDLGEVDTEPHPYEASAEIIGKVNDAVEGGVWIFTKDGDNLGHEGIVFDGGFRWTTNSVFVETDELPGESRAVLEDALGARVRFVGFVRSYDFNGRDGSRVVATGIEVIAGSR